MQHLSTRLTFFQKAIGLLWIALVVAYGVFFIVDTKSLWGLAFFVMVIPALGLINIYQIRFDDNNVYLRKWVKVETFPLSMVKSLNAGEMFSWSFFFQLEIMDENEEVRLVNFMPDWVESLHYYFTKRYVGQLMDFKLKLRKQKIV